MKSREIVAWLKEEYGLGYGHAGAIYYMIVHADDVKARVLAWLMQAYDAA